jgi:GAF domain-containing protein
MNESIHGERTASELQDQVTELIEQQTAISEVLRAIASSPHDLQPIFDAILDSATRLCRADVGSLRLSEESGLRLVAVRGDALLVSQVWSSFPVLAEKGSHLSRIATSRLPTHIPDLAAVEGDLWDDLRITAVNAGFRTSLAVPLLKANEIVGIMSLGRKQVQPFTDKQISLFRDFAAQATIALESTASLPWASSPPRLLMKSSSPLRRHATTPLLHCGF